MGSNSVDEGIGHWKGHLGGALLCGSGHQSLEGAPGWGLALYSVRQTFDGPVSLLFICQCWRVGRERLWRWLHPLASRTAWLSSTGTSRHDLLPHIPSLHVSAGNSSPCPGIAPGTLNSSSQQLCLLGDLPFCPGYVCGKDCLTLLPFRLRRSAVHAQP